MTAGETMVWASAFSGAVRSGCKPEVAVRMATRAVQQLRAVDLAKLSEDEREAFTEMRGSDAELRDGEVPNAAP